MSTQIRILIVLVTAAVQLGAVYYGIQFFDVSVGGWKYCLIIGFGVAMIFFAWDITAPKKPHPPQSS